MKTDAQIRKEIADLQGELVTRKLNETAAATEHAAKLFEETQKDKEYREKTAPYVAAKQAEQLVADLKEQIEKNGVDIEDPFGYAYKGLLSLEKTYFTTFSSFKVDTPLTVSGIKCRVTKAELSPAGNVFHVERVPR